MAKTNYQDFGSKEIVSPDITGLHDILSKMEDILDMETAAEINIPLTEIYISEEDRYRIFQAPVGKRNWSADPEPVIKKNGVAISTGFEIHYVGGAIILPINASSNDTYTADVTYVTNVVVPNYTPEIYNTSSFFTMGNGKLENGDVAEYADLIRNGQVNVGLEGNTLFNCADNGIDYGNWVITGIGTTKGVNGVHLVVDGINEKAELPINLKSNTEYTLVLNVKDKTITNIGIYDSTIIDSIQIFSPVVGINKIKIITKSDIAVNELHFRCGNDNIDGQYIDFELYAILEGDYTNDDSVNKPFKFGINSTLCAGRIKDVGKNLFDGELESGGFYTTDGTFVTPSNDNFAVKNKYIPILNSNIYWKFFVETGWNIRFFWYDINKSFIAFDETSGEYGSVIPPSNVRYMNFRIYKNGSGVVIPNVKVFLSHTEIPITFIKHEASKSYILSTTDGVIDELNSVGGVADRIYQENSKTLKRKNTNKTILDGSESWDLLSTYTNTYRFGLNDIVSDGLQDASANASMIINNQLFNYEYGVADNEHFYFGSDSLILLVNQSTINTQEGVTTLEKFKNWLSAMLTYQLSEPITTEIQVDGQPYCYGPGSSFEYMLYCKRKKTYKNADGGIKFEIPVTQIDELETFADGVYKEIETFEYTLADNGLSATVTVDGVELTDNTVLMVYAPYDPSYSTQPTIVTKYSLDREATLESALIASQVNSRQISSAKDNMTLMYAETDLKINMLDARVTALEP